MIPVKKCENVYCCFWENDRCVLEGITVDEYGHCREYVYPEIPKEYFDKMKMGLRRKILEI